MEKRIATFSPPDGLIQTLMVTEKQYNSMNFITGEFKKDVRNSAERTIII